MKPSVRAKNKRRIAVVFLILGLLLTVLIFRVGKYQIIDAKELTEKAIEQQTRDTPIEAKRGIIFDRNGKELATSITCYTLWARPAQINKDGVDTVSEEELLARAEKIAEIVGEETDDVIDKLNKKQSLVKISKYLDKTQADELRKLDFKGLDISEETRRYYPQETLASQVLGSVTDDNTGRSGLELEYDQYLSGVSGRWVKNTDLFGNELVEGSEEYFEATDGYNLITTIDEAIQYYVEKASEKGMETTGAKRIMCLAMNPKTGEILASSVIPGFNPNNPLEPLDKDALETFENLDVKEQNKYLFDMWRNGVISDTYEPGSTFKLLTSSSALESGTVSVNSHFYCDTRFTIAGVTLHCWSTVGHGDQDLYHAVANSCNPALATISTNMGKETFYSLLKQYGVMDKTGVDYPGEANSIIQSLDSVGPVELATIGYGQGISITPIQLLTAVCAIGNDGVLMQPRYVNALTDQEGNVVKKFEPQEVRKVLSKETADEMKSIMKYVMDTKGGAITDLVGYRVGGKTGTANKVENGRYGDNYYSSFIGMAPMDDPQIALLVIVDSPKGTYYGTQVASPIARDIFQDTFRYLNIAPEYTEEEKDAIERNLVKVPDITSMEVEEAIGILKATGLKYKSEGSALDSNYNVADQYPKAGELVKKGTVVYLYSD